MPLYHPLSQVWLEEFSERIGSRLEAGQLGPALEGAKAEVLAEAGEKLEAVRTALAASVAELSEQQLAELGQQVQGKADAAAVADLERRVMQALGQLRAAQQQEGGGGLGGKAAEVEAVLSALQEEAAAAGQALRSQATSLASCQEAVRHVRTVALRQAGDLKQLQEAAAGLDARVGGLACKLAGVAHDDMALSGAAAEELLSQRLAAGLQSADLPGRAEVAAALQELQEQARRHTRTRARQLA